MKSLALSLLLALSVAGCSVGPPQNVNVPGAPAAPARRGAPPATPAPPPGAPALTPPILPMDPASFVATVDNPYLPLRPGATFLFERRRIIGSRPDTDTVMVTRDVRTILGVRAVVVRERWHEKGRLISEHTDAYAQDRIGNVWRLASETRAFGDSGRVTTTAWEAGKDSAFAGVVMPGEPEVGMVFRTGWRRGVAEGVGRVTSISATSKVMNDSFNPCIVIEEQSAIAIGVLLERIYAPSVGLIQEHGLRSGADLPSRILAKLIVAP